MEKTIYSDDYTRVRQWLREQRKEKGLTMRELGERLGVIHSWVGKVELGERRLDLIEYVHYCNAPGIDPHEGLDLIIRPAVLGTDLLAAEGKPKYKTRGKR